MVYRKSNDLIRIGRFWPKKKLQKASKKSIVIFDCFNEKLFGVKYTWHQDVLLGQNFEGKVFSP